MTHNQNPFHMTEEQFNRTAYIKVPKTLYSIFEILSEKEIIAAVKEKHPEHFV